MRKFRAIVQTHKEPLDHEVLWYWKGKLLYWDNGEWQPFLLIDAIEIPYTTEEDKSLTTVQLALDKLIYVAPEVTLVSNISHIPERGEVLDTVKFIWNYNKELIKRLQFNDQKIPESIREVEYKDVSEDISAKICGDDGTNKVCATIDIEFSDYIYYGVIGDGLNIIHKLSPDNPEISIDTSSTNKAWVFIPDSLGLTKIWHNNIDSTDAFVQFHTSHRSSTGVSVEGIYYISKHEGLGELTLKFT